MMAEARAMRDADPLYSVQLLRAAISLLPAGDPLALEAEKEITAIKSTAPRAP